MPTTITEQVDTGEDDGYCSGAATFDNSGVAAMIGTESDLRRDAFYRWADVTIPKGALIDSAKIQLYGRFSSGSPLTKIYFEKAADPDAPADAADYDGRTPTDESVDWDGALTLNEWNDSPDIKAVIQELVDAYDYSGTAAMVCLHKNDGTVGTKYTRGATQEYDDNLKGAKLVIEYSAPNAGSTEASAAIILDLI